MDRHVFRKMVPEMMEQPVSMQFVYEDNVDSPAV